MGKQIQLGGNELKLLAIQTDLNSKKPRKLEHHPSASFPRLNSFTHSSSTFFPHTHPEWHRGMQNERLWSVHSTFPPPHIVPLLQCGLFERLQSFRINLLQHGLCRGCRATSALVPGAPSPPPSTPLTSMLTRLFLTLYFSLSPHSLCCVSGFS